MPLRPLPPRVDEKLSSRRAAQLNLYRALANSPEAVEGWLDFLWTLRDDFVTPRRLRELLILRVAAREGSAYEWHHHEQMGLASGLTADEIAAARPGTGAGPGSAAAFEGTDALALELADAVAAGHVDEALAARAVAELGERAFVELAVTASAYVMVARVLDALGVPLEGS